MHTNSVRNTVIPTLSVALSGITFGTIGYFGTKLFELGFSASQILLWRFILASLCIIPFTIKTQRDHKISFKALSLCFLLGGVFYSLSTYCFFLALPLIGSGVAMVLFYAFPILVAFFSWAIDKKKLGLTEIFSMVIIFPGIALLAITEDADFNQAGILLGLASALSYGIYFFASKRFSQNLSPMLSSLMICFGNIIFFTFIGIYENSLNIPQKSAGWLLLIGFAFVGTVLPLWLLFIGFKKVNVTKASLISILEPISTVFIGIWFLEEMLSIHQVIGIVILLFAAIIVQFNFETKKNIALQPF